MKTFLHAGSGQKTYREIPVRFDPSFWKEVRLDIDPKEKPDIVADITNMPSVVSETYDAVFTSHTLEHLYPNDVKKALDEFFRVLKPDGVVIITCPDLEIIASLITQGKVVEKMYESPEGPVTPLDMLYGFRPALAAGRTYMAHHTGFTLPVLCDSLKAVGFPSVTGMRRMRDFEVWALGSKKQIDEKNLKMLAQTFFPT